MPYFRSGAGLYFRSYGGFYAIMNENYATVPFLLLFVWGYLYTDSCRLSQSWFAHLRFGVNAPEMRPPRVALRDFSCVEVVAPDSGFAPNKCLINSRMAIQREQLEADVLIVGRGTRGLACVRLHLCEPDQRTTRSGGKARTLR